MKIVKIIWKDSGYCQMGWQQPDDYLEWAKKEPLIAETVGFLVHKSKTHVTVCLSIIKDNQEITEYAEGIKIPMSQIKSIKQLTTK